MADPAAPPAPVPPHWSRGPAAYRLRNITFVIVGLIFAFVVAAIVFAPKPGIHSFAKPASATPAEIARYDEAVRVFLETCAPVTRYWRDVESARVGSTTVIWQTEAFGWTDVSVVEVVLQVSPKANASPGDWVANGHTLRYVLGAGPRGTGLTAAKSVEKRFCGSDDDSNRTILIPAPGLAFLAR